MQVLALALLLAFAAAAEEAEDRRSLAIAGLEARQRLPRQPASPDPCGVARQIVHQPACLARGDCRALELWKRSFGAPRFERLDPGRVTYRSLAAGRGPAQAPPPPMPDPRWRLRPDTICAAGVEPRR